MKYKRLGIFLVIAVVFLVLAVYSTFVRVPVCQTFECFESHMNECEAVRYLNDGEQATWRYEVLGMENSACVVEVTLLQPKEGELGIEELSGYSMKCGFPKGFATYPEKDLGSCSGRLKEEMQEIIIEKLHKYIVDNIGDIDKGLNLLVREIS